jgi:hypothetical protein
MEQVVKLSTKSSLRMELNICITSQSQIKFAQKEVINVMVMFLALLRIKL